MVAIEAQSADKIKLLQLSEEQSKQLQLENNDLLQEVIVRGEWGKNLEGSLAKSQENYGNIIASNSWKYTRPLREISRFIKSPKPQLARYNAFVMRRLSESRLRQTNTFKAKDRLKLHESYPRINEIIFPKYKSPKVSVIIPVYGKVEYTLKCLLSIIDNLPKVPFEIIVVDDCSPDNSIHILQTIKTITLVQNTENLGFIGSCNAGAAKAHSEYLLFLNNDTEVYPGWADELFDTFKNFPGTGFVGSKLIYPDGRLQEAGGIVWNDGNIWNFGRLQDPDDQIYSYAREVDYCSGASIMVPTKLFNKYDGFDKHYTPAYCEDCDLAIKIRNDGYRVLYQPLSKVIHYEGITSGTDLSQGAKSYQVENMKKMFARWKHMLKHHQESGVDVDSAKDRMASHRVLFISQNIGTVKNELIINLMLQFRELGFQTTLSSISSMKNKPSSRMKLQKLGIEVLYSPYTSSLNEHLDNMGSRYDIVIFTDKGLVEKDCEKIRNCCKEAKVLQLQLDPLLQKNEKLSSKRVDGLLCVLKKLNSTNPNYLGQIPFPLFTHEKNSLKLLLNRKKNTKEITGDLNEILHLLEINTTPRHFNLDL